MAALMGARKPVVAAAAAVFIIAALALATYRFAGAAPALVLLGVGNAIVVLAVLLAAARRERQAVADHALGARALEAVPHAVFVVDDLRPGRPNRYVNAAYAALTGYDAARAVDEGFDALAIFADPAAVAGTGRKTLAPQRVTVRRSDGELLAATLELEPVIGPEQTRWIGFLAPAGARALDRRQPRTDETAAASGHDAFLSALSHDLRSPLNACVMWLDVLALAPQPDKVLKAVEAIKRNLARQTKLINDLNDAAKVSSNRLEVPSESLDLVELLRGRIDAWQLLALGKELGFEPTIETESAVLLGDAGRLSQILDHLMENAVSSTAAGGRVTLRVRTSSSACIVEIEDTGTVLSPEDAANLHRPLWRSPTGAKNRPGLGLSLAVAHHLAARHGGTLDAASADGRTRFTLTLPLAIGDPPRPQTASADDRSAAE